MFPCRALRSASPRRFGEGGRQRGVDDRRPVVRPQQPAERPTPRPATAGVHAGGAVDLRPCTTADQNDGPRPATWYGPPGDKQRSSFSGTRPHLIHRQEGNTPVSTVSTIIVVVPIIGQYATA